MNDNDFSPKEDKNEKDNTIPVEIINIEPRKTTE